MSFAQTYRPHHFGDLVSQDFVRVSLTSALRSGKIAGAYVFSGPRGTGKTTTARLLAQAMNCTTLGNDAEPCGKCTACVAFENGSMVDLVEIDAASNTGVDNVREIIEHARFQPSIGRYKVYIIDEVHMLSRGAFNALLKTLEEPPPHARFILATTEADRIPETILSRAQHYVFRLFSPEQIATRLTFIAEQEHLSIEPEAIALVARMAAGGMRDAITLLEQCAAHASGGTILAESVRQELGLVGGNVVSHLFELLRSANRTGISEALLPLKARSADIRRLIEDLLLVVRDAMMNASNPQEIHTFGRYFDTLHATYTDLKTAPDGWLLLEVRLVGITVLGQTISIPVSAPVSAPATFSTKPASKPTQITSPTSLFFSKTIPEGEPEVHAPHNTTLSKQNSLTEDKNPTEIPVAPPATTEAFSYPRLIEAVAKIPKKAFIAMSMKVSRFTWENGTLTLIAPNAFHGEKLQSADSIAAITMAVQNTFGTSAQIRVEIGEGSVNNRLLADAADIF